MKRKIAAGLLMALAIVALLALTSEAATPALQVVVSCTAMLVLFLAYKGLAALGMFNPEN